MRTLLSQLLTDSAKQDPNFVVLSGDHGYALFDQIQRERKKQFINVGVAEQMMVGVAAGLAKRGFRPCVYGLSAFVPIRVLEQIKLDVCFSKLPVIFLGDGAGLVYSTLGASHQAAEDIACLRPMPYLKIFSPCDVEELRACYAEASAYSGPSYIRLGKSDRPVVNTQPLSSTEPHWVIPPSSLSKISILASGSMAAIGVEAAKKHGLPFGAIPRIKPFSTGISRMLQGFSEVIVIEEHSRYGGLTSALTDALIEQGMPIPRIHVLSLEDKFSDRCGGYQFALSEHHMSDAQVLERIGAILSSR